MTIREAINWIAGTTITDLIFYWVIIFGGLYFLGKFLMFFAGSGGIVGEIERAEKRVARDKKKRDRLMSSTQSEYPELRTEAIEERVEKELERIKKRNGLIILMILGSLLIFQFLIFTFLFT